MAKFVITNTNQAMAYGRSIRGDRARIQELQNEVNYLNSEYAHRRHTADEATKWNLAYKIQLINEALESARSR